MLRTPSVTIGMIRFLRKLREQHRPYLNKLWFFSLDYNVVKLDSSIYKGILKLFYPVVLNWGTDYE